MRILFVSQEYPPETGHGGIGTQTAIKAHGLAALGHEVHVLSASPDCNRHEYMDRTVHVVRTPGAHGRLALHEIPAQWVTYSVEVAIEIASLHSRGGFDLVDFAEYGGEGYVHLLNRTHWNYVPAAVQLHGPLAMLAHTIGWPELDSEFYRVGTAMESTCVRLADTVYSSSRCSAEWCAAHYGLRVDETPILHTGVDTDRFQPGLCAKDDRLTVVSVGRLERSKGVFQLLEAAALLRRQFPELRLRLIGPGHDHVIQELRAAEHRLGSSGLLDLPGFVGHDELPSELQKAHVFALPSRYEGGPGFACLEAMACGLPVIVSSGSGAAESVIDGETGLLVPPDEVAELASALQPLLADRSEREKLGRRARAHVLENADSRACLKRLETLYSSLARRQAVESG